MTINGRYSCDPINKKKRFSFPFFIVIKAFHSLVAGFASANFSQRFIKGHIDITAKCAKRHLFKQHQPLGRQYSSNTVVPCVFRMFRSSLHKMRVCVKYNACLEILRTHLKDKYKYTVTTIFLEHLIVNLYCISKVKRNL